MEFLRAVFRGRFHRKYRRAVKALAPYLGKSGVVFDIGGNQGRFAREFARFENGACRVHLFEPFADNLKLCAVNLQSSKNATIHPFALSNQNAAIDMIIPLTTDGGDDSATPYIEGQAGHAGAGPKGGGTRKIRIECRRLDDMMNSESLPVPTFIKIDVEGHATKVLRGAKATIEKHLPNMLIEISKPMETRGDGDARWIVDYLKDLGYRAWFFDIKAGEMTRVDFGIALKDADILFAR